MAKFFASLCAVLVLAVAGCARPVLSAPVEQTAVVQVLKHTAAKSTYVFGPYIDGVKIRTGWHWDHEPERWGVTLDCRWLSQGHDETTLIRDDQESYLVAEKAGLHQPVTLVYQVESRGVGNQPEIAPYSYRFVELRPSR